MIVALKKPSEYFKKDIITDNNSDEGITNRTSELNTFSDAFELFKSNLSKISTISEFSHTLENYQLNIEKINYLSDKIEDIKEEIGTLLKKEDLDHAMMSQLIFVEESLHDVSKYKQLIVNSKRKTESKLENFDRDIIFLKNLVENNFRESNYTKEELEKKITDLEVKIIRNESYLKTQNKNFEDIQENIESFIQKFNIQEICKQNNRLGKKIKYLEELFDKFSEREILTEGMLNEPPSVGNKDPLTPLDQNYVTFEQLQQHYRLFINRLQQQLATFGGGGETKLKYLDDIVGIATNAPAYDTRYLKYDHTTEKFVFSPIDTDNVSTRSITVFENDVPFSFQQAFSRTTNSTNPTSIHNSLSSLKYSTVEYTIQAIKINDVVTDDIVTTKIVCVNDTVNINSTEVYSVSIGSTFVSYDINISNGHINLVAIPTSLAVIVYNVSYNAISRPISDFIISTENNEVLISEEGNTIQIEVS